MTDADLIVVGGGAAGIFCAVNAARMKPGLRVLVIEKTDKLLSKVKVSGGGRCNLTHDCDDIETMSRAYPRGRHFVRKAFHHFFTADTVQWFAERGVNAVAEPDGRMFPSTNLSETVMACLLGDAGRYGVKFLLHAELVDLCKEGDLFSLRLKDGRAFSASYVCMATGGYRKREQYAWIESLGHTVVIPVPSLFTFNLPGHTIRSLTGVSVAEASVRLQGEKVSHRGPLLITHWGLSGPAVLKASAWHAREMHASDYQFVIQVQWLPDTEEADARRVFMLQRADRGRMGVWTKNPFGLPSRLWQYLAATAEVGENLRWADLTSKQQEKILGLLFHQSFQVSGKTTFKEEFVTAGGISTSEIDASTMQSRLVPGLYIAGEAMDVDGITGGYNFQHAWTSGWIAASHISRSFKG